MVSWVICFWSFSCERGWIGFSLVGVLGSVSSVCFVFVLHHQLVRLVSVGVCGCQGCLVVVGGLCLGQEGWGLAFEQGCWGG